MWDTGVVPSTKVCHSTTPKPRNGELHVATFTAGLTADKADPKSHLHTFRLSSAVSLTLQAAKLFSDRQWGTPRIIGLRATIRRIDLCPTQNNLAAEAVHHLS